MVVSRSAHSLSIASEKLDEVDFLLETVCRDPVYVDDEEAYKTYLYDSEQPKLYSDETDNVIRIIGRIDPSVDCSRYKPLELKDLLYDLLDREKQRFLDAESRRIKNYEEYDSIVETYEDIRSNRTGVGRYYDAPLMFEWNTWRAMTMIDGGEMSANLGFDDAGRPMHVAMGNMPDIVCDYGSFVLNVEVTLQSGQRQYDNEGEPVARHVGTMRRSTGKPVCCFFIARKIHPATLAHFYVLLRTEVEHYGGKALIVPLELTVFEKMLADSRKAAYVPRSEQILSFVEKARGAGEAAENENDWFGQVRDLALNWLSDA